MLRLLYYINYEKAREDRFLWAQESLQCIKARWIYGQYDEKVNVN